ncbi:MAG: ABC transporter permease [Brevibacterium aurantiacum]|uniref:ABC transporter permease n=1 Tax=Brevibacterium aurantiacum TaxID=273384 RepID=A0A1D7W7K4_BREAU|nr:MULTISPECIES: ABC transporter permease [Brevibacterium]MDN5549497.1 ABC transporter permease [Brevibacterium sp.]AOP54628.1 Ribose ABC transport system, permease protein RbsC [Brevibacterium aurantiacum]AZL06546.1 ABC transporter permease [Brevibacterium aurantiacum]AZL10138.1 ABC transporter permease [Brevibacterium aurantiacum]AZL13843.1 ABC transporter permease [Brevibacterium aurantiacum]
MTTDISPAAPSPAPPPTAEAEPGKEQNLLQEILSGSWLVSVLSIVVALLLGGVLIAVSNAEVVAAAQNFLGAPGAFFSTLFSTVGEAYSALFRGSIFDWNARTPERAIRPLTESLVSGTPLILTGLGIAMAFRCGLFNIGGQGQVILGATIAGFLGYALHLPPIVHMLIAAIGGIIGGAIWAGIAGVLKARTGANEVIVTIMLNSIAGYLLGYLLKQSWFTHTTSANPQSRAIDDTSEMFLMLPPPFRLHFGFILAILATIFVWWLLERSTIGFEFKAVGANPHAARTAGISVSKVTILVMVVAGALAGLGGAAQVLGTEGKLTGGISGSIGFDAITVALLGRSKPWGTFMAGLLFGAFKAGGYLMQSQTGTPIDIVLVVQSVIVLLIAAPPLVRSIFRLPTPVLKRKEA